MQDEVVSDCKNLRCIPPHKATLTSCFKSVACFSQTLAFGLIGRKAMASGVIK